MCWILYKACVGAIMLRVTPLTSSYSPLLPYSPEIQQLHTMYTIGIGRHCRRGSQQTNSGKAEVCHMWQPVSIINEWTRWNMAQWLACLWGSVKWHRRDWLHCMRSCHRPGSLTQHGNRSIDARCSVLAIVVIVGVHVRVLPICYQMLICGKKSRTKQNKTNATSATLGELF